MPPSVRLIPYECGKGATTNGCSSGPHILTENPKMQELIGQLDIEWIRTPQNPKNHPKPTEQAEYTDEQRRDMVLPHVAKIRKDVTSVIQNKHFPLTIGGDHSIAAGSIRGLADAYNDASLNIGVLWIDAHPDLNTWDSSQSKSLHGMSLSALLGLGGAMTFSDEKAVLNGEHVCIIGARDIDDPEIAHARETGATIITMDEVREMGVTAAFNKAMAIISKAKYRAVSFDLDSLSPTITHNTGQGKQSFDLATGTPVEGGFTRDEILGFFGTLNMKDLHLFEIVEYNPHLNNPRQTATLIAEVIEAALS